MQVKAPDRAAVAHRVRPPHPPRRPRTTRSLWHSRTVQGIGYAAPTAVFVAVFFVWPLLLVGQMSLND
jgi:multiple sugar transport system permease protein